ncbi:hypothetical protein [Kordia zhangzhouensis]|uniref:hypothetical protein n=1 Tax=Kordia zhangzhouensis TaxID=1620405 RepID=UPI0006295E49|nr:hypothetical protein [Kordia zhangzhouensis]
MKTYFYAYLIIYISSTFFVQSQNSITPIEDAELFKILVNMNEHTVISRSNEYFRMQAIKVTSDERAIDDEDIQVFKSFYYIVIADYEESPNGKLYKTSHLISPQLMVYPDSYKFFKILITHGKEQEQQLVLFASNEKLYVKKE